ncbi:MAG: PQQ-dependent sugar dehydrogenase [Kangiellaceae bacterium]|jgi:glucose/arabinose dehydrogenase|nr:PQQ-dependent sugar dehydrogenase [Kangiellaceae bacterium]
MKNTLTKLMRTLALASISAALSLPLTAKDEDYDLIIDELVIPWGMVQLPDGSFLVTEREGKLFHIDVKNKKRMEISGLPAISQRNQGGLLDLELHPDYAKNGWLYMSMVTVGDKSEGEGDHTTIARAKLSGNKLTDFEILYKGTPNGKRPYHYGSRLEFDNEGYLYFTIGDRGERDVNPQDINRDGGKVYRIHDDGRIPKSNPFVSGKKPAIFSYGHRNPQGMAKNPWSGDIWVHEHGPKGGDEINISKPAKNYGWPIISYGINYNGTVFTEITEKEGMEQPILHWTPSIAPSGMTFVTSDKYPKWKGHLLAGSLKFGYLVLVKLDGDKVVGQEIVYEGIGRTRNIRQMPDGYIYVAVDGEGIKQLTPQ